MAGKPSLIAVHASIEGCKASRPNSTTDRLRSGRSALSLAHDPLTNDRSQFGNASAATAVISRSVVAGRRERALVSIVARC